MKFNPPPSSKDRLDAHEKVLRALIKKHRFSQQSPKWSEIEAMLVNGSTYPLDEQIPPKVSPWRLSPYEQLEDAREQQRFAWAQVQEIEKELRDEKLFSAKVEETLDQTRKRVVALTETMAEQKREIDEFVAGAKRQQGTIDGLRHDVLVAKQRNEALTQANANLARALTQAEQRNDEGTTHDLIEAGRLKARIKGLEDELTRVSRAHIVDPPGYGKTEINRLLDQTRNLRDSLRDSEQDVEKLEEEVARLKRARDEVQRIGAETQKTYQRLINERDEAMDRNGRLIDQVVQARNTLAVIWDRYQDARKEAGYEWPPEDGLTQRVMKALGRD